MNDLNDQDWELINAYHDGELGAKDKRAMESRLAVEPALALALEELRGMSSSLAAMRPESRYGDSAPGGRAANDNWWPGRWVAGGAISAVLAIAFVVGPSIFAKPTVLDIHAEFAAQPVSSSDGDLRPVVAASSEDVPDLSGANLTPVFVRALDDGQVTHYAGRNGCRLSYFRGAVGGDDPGRLSDHQVEAWTTADNLLHMIVATGMDQSKFDAIATYLKYTSRQKATETILAAVSDATTAAGPCVG
ncbi:hypothetical protein AAFO92_10275 [Roseovarius sp. CAU 1744]|uniref:anti-sigma factor n=1 Tax=Roseovarius sp. CAU 1744 TaxID=3140368 RepID=UPI00325BABE2